MNKLISKSIYDSKTLMYSRQNLSKDEWRIIFMCLEKSRRNNEININGEYWFSASDYCEIFKITRHEAIRDIKAAQNKLSERWIHINKGDTEESMRWIGKKMKNTRSGIYGVIFWHEILPYLQELKSQLINVPVEWLANMNSESNSRFLRWINEAIESNKTQLELKIDDIRYYLDIRDSTSYKIYNNLKRRIIEPAIKNINEETDLNLSFKEIKTKRKVTSIIIEWS